MNAVQEKIERLKLDGRIEDKLDKLFIHGEWVSSGKTKKTPIHALTGYFLTVFRSVPHAHHWGEYTDQNTAFDKLLK